MPLAYEVLAGNTADSTTLRGFLARIERQYGKARRIWVMDRGIPTEAVLEEMRAADPPVQLSGRHAEGPPEPAGEGTCSASPGSEARPGVQVKLLPQDGELYVFAESAIASPRSARCAGGSSSGCGRGSSSSRP